ncbi:MAG: HAMP domain-containing histidine kinase [Polyangiaceae bacterium]|nr:HAMP domain-containing histidine kinase [Polyangiaceae bacterium]
MTRARASLVTRVFVHQVLFSLGAALGVSLIPRLLLLEGAVAQEASRALLAALAVGALPTLGLSAWVLRGHRFTLHALSRGTRPVESWEAEFLSEDVWRITVAWLVPPMVSLGLLASAWRPATLDPFTAVSSALLGSVFVAAAALSLHAVVRAAFARTVEVGRPETLGDAAEQSERSDLPRRRTHLRLLLAVTLPVAIVIVGSALITSSHLRRADSDYRSETARLLARTSFRQHGVADREVGALATRHGFSVSRSPTPLPAEVSLGEDGVAELSLSLDSAGLRVRFSGTTLGILSPSAVALLLAFLLLGGLLGSSLGRALARDLALATDSVRLLGTEALLSSGTRVMEVARFGDVRALGEAIDGVAARFRTFARAQERAIAARERAARMRGLFFASVSHDLKSPLNAILGFTELVRQTEPLTDDQLESLDVIEQRGRELLALIETVLDAARVDAGQLELVREAVVVSELVTDAVRLGRDLGGGRAVEVVTEVHEGVPLLHADRTRCARALSTLIGHAIRTADRDYLRMRVVPSRTGGVRIDVEVPGSRLEASELAALLDPKRAPPRGEHRGLSLGLGLARAVIDLHGGSIVVSDREDKGSIFTVRLPAGAPNPKRANERP